MLIVVAGVLALVTAGAAITGYVLYDRASTPDRSTPDVAVISYLQAALVNHDSNRAKLFTCDGGIPALDEFAGDLARREDELGVSFSINIEDVAVSEAGTSGASVIAVIRRSATIDGIQQSLADTWRFDLKDKDGWRVCAGSRIG
ncbi:hypothetical protein O7634_07680 [Micromonospora sp. WMMD1120]|uniref:hypothetical protein n=1 Tax=Micromonospora sp. WMMD1120 TaxID=3016106 RepID=UPI0024164A39|nr:hypothetical protein [Micromonospora sp. WMMD1120]MDG4806636.1 hypothetical protein [Micromonospora sp. WMMD1120]